MSLANLPWYLLTAVAFLVMISVLVAAHEYGHYVFARLFGMGVEEFAIGMGKKLKIWRRKTYEIPVPPNYVHEENEVSKGSAFEGGARVSNSELVETPSGRALRETTEFTVRMLPVGGFVRIKGMIPHEDGSEVRIPGGFYSKPPWQRLIVLVAGPAASVLAGLVALIILFMTFGEHKFVDKSVLGVVSKDTPAGKAGLKEGDRIVAINDQPIEKFSEMLPLIRDNGGQKINMEYVRGDQRTKIELTPEVVESGGMNSKLEFEPAAKKHGRIGILPKRQVVVLGFAEATKEAVRVPVEAIAGILRIAEKPSSLKDEAGGAVTMVAATHDAVVAGIDQVILLACLLSISVGIFNLLPIPPLDGGQMAMAFAELLRGGRRLSMQVQQVVTSAGVFLVLVLFIVVFFIDIQRFTGGGQPGPAPVTAPAKK